MSMMDTPTTGSSPRNSRLAHLRKFVCVPPERGFVLRLVTCEDPPLVIGEWMRGACIDNTATAEEIDTRLREHAVTQQTEVAANLVWQSEEAQIVVSKRLRCKPDSEVIDPAQAEALGLVGTESGERLQRQRHEEVRLRLWVGAIQQQQQMMLDTLRERDRMHAEAMKQHNEQLKIMAQMVNDSMKASHAAHIELDKVRAQQRRDLDTAADRLRALRDQGPEPDPEKSAKATLIAQVSEGLGQALPIVLEMVTEKVLGLGPSAGDDDAPAAAPTAAKPPT